MFEISKILCPTDFSPATAPALEAAGVLAQQTKAEVTLVHAIRPIMPVTAGPGPDTNPVFDAGTYLKVLQQDAERDIAEAAQSFEQAGVRVRTLVELGEEADQIVDVAERQNTDLILIATHGRTGWRRFLLGSVAERVVRTASCPVLVVPAAHEEDD